MSGSDLSRIDDAPKDPMELFVGWLKDAQNNGHANPKVLCLATSRRDGSVNARSLILRRTDPDGIVITTNKFSEKVAEIKENPQAAVTFLWDYTKNQRRLSRQVRMKCSVSEMSPEEYQEIYESEPPFCKLRAHICDQGKPADWQQLKTAHDELLADFLHNKNTLPMPQQYVGYKLIPSLVDFYHADESAIADRICYRKNENTWSSSRIAA